MFRFGKVDQTIFYLNIVSFLHTFYIEKCQEFAYFDIFLGIVQKKMKNAKFGTYLMQKGTFRTKPQRHPKERDQITPVLMDKNFQRAN